MFFHIDNLFVYFIFFRHLDISQTNKRQGRYEFANLSLRTLVQSLPDLSSLDISGTNLAGTGTYDDLKGKYSTFYWELALRSRILVITHSPGRISDQNPVFSHDSSCL